MGKRSHKPQREANKRAKRDLKWMSSLHKIEYKDDSWHVPSKVIEAISANHVPERQYTPDMPTSATIPKVQYPNFRPEMQLLFAKVVYNIEHHPKKKEVLDLMQEMHDKFDLEGEKLIWNREVKEAYDNFWRVSQFIGPIFLGILN